MWKRSDGGKSCNGRTVEGDTTVPPTRWWNHWWLVWRGWSTVAVFEVKTDKAFRVGYRDAWATAYINTDLLNVPVTGARPLGRTTRWPHFNLLVGFEDCTFFAVDEDGNEVPITLIKRTPRKDITFNDGYRLY